VPLSAQSPPAWDRVAGLNYAFNYHQRTNFPPRVRCAKPGSTARQFLSEKLNIPSSGCAEFLTGWRRIRLTCLWSMPCPLQHTTRGDGYAKREFPPSASAMAGSWMSSCWREPRIKFPLVLDDGTLYLQPGRLLFSDASVDPSTGQVTLRGEFPNPKGAPVAERPGCRAAPRRPRSCPGRCAGPLPARAV